MTQPAEEQAVERDHGCQTPECPNDFAVIIIRVDDSTTEMLCDGCHMVMMLAIMQAMAEDGTLVLPVSVTRDEPASTPAV